MVLCIPYAYGVPGQLAPPNWWDTEAPPNSAQQYNKDYDDARWQGSSSQNFGYGTSPETTFRALFRADASDPSITYLYLSWIVWWDNEPTSPDLDGLYVGFKTPSATLIIKVTVSNDQTDKTADPAYAIAVLERGANGVGKNAGETPAWLNDTVRVWKSGAAHSWVVQMRVPLKSGAALSKGIDANPANFKMWYCHEVHTDTFPDPSHLFSGLVRMAWPLGTEPVWSDQELALTFPHPDTWDSFQIGAVKTSVTSVSCSATSGVSFGYYDVGTTNAPASQINFKQQIATDPPVLQPTNTFFISPQNLTGAQIDAGHLRATVRLANWGSIASPNAFKDKPILDQLSTAAIPDGGSAQAFAMSWAPDFNWAVNLTPQPPATTPARSRHQCIYVEVFANGQNAAGKDINFVNSSIYRNMDFAPMSTFSRDAEISVVGLLPFSAEPRDVYLSIEARRMPERRAPYVKGDYKHYDFKIDAKPAIDAKTSEEYIQKLEEALASGRIQWSELEQSLPTFRVHCYYDTGRRETRGGRTYVILGLQAAFGYFAVHVGSVDGWATNISGAQRVAKNLYVVKVPNNGVAKINTRLQAVEPGEERPPADPIVPYKPPAGGEVDLLDCILALIDKILALLDRLAACEDRIDPLHALLKRLARAIRLLPLPNEIREALAKLIERVAGVQTRMSVLGLLREALAAVEQHLEQLDRILDRLRPIGEQRRKELLEKLFGADAGRLEQEIEALEARVQKLAGLIRLLDGVLDTLNQLADGCHQIDGLQALLRGLGRTLDKLSALGAGLEKRFPFLDKIIPSADPSRGALQNQIEALEKNGALFDEIVRLLERLGEDAAALGVVDKDLDDLAYEEIARVSERLYKAAFG